jgi:RNA polymerase sigma-70 factor (ECF subfamily)
MDTREFTDILRRHAGLIHKIAHVYCRDAMDREDVIQEVALQLWRSRNRYDERYKETTWIYRIAVNVAISFYRRERRHRERRLSLDDPAITIAAPSVETSEDVQLLLRCIDDLGVLDKALVVFHLEGLDHKSISDVLGISVSNVGTKLLRVKQKLRVALEQRAPRLPETTHADR